MSCPLIPAVSWMPQLRAVPVAFSLLLLPGASRAAPALDCPVSIQEKSIQVVEVPTGWNPFTRSPLYLHGAAPMNGPPEKMRELSDFRQTRRKKEWTYTYQLDGKYPEGIWLACSYGETDQVTLSKRLDDSIRTCTFKYKTGEHVGQTDIAIRCQ